MKQAICTYSPILLFLFTFGACTCQYKKHSKDNYTLVKDNLYIDGNDELYLKSKTMEHFDTGNWIDVWIKTVYCDSCWTPTAEGWEDITTLNDFIDTASFHLVYYDSLNGGDLYADKHYQYFHKHMADGGTITLIQP